MNQSNTLGTPTALYRMFDGEGQLLYVGISGDLLRRFEHHRRFQPWWTEIATITVAHYDDRGSAGAAELAAIKGEHPRHNITGQPILGAPGRPRPAPPYWWNFRGKHHRPRSPSGPTVWLRLCELLPELHQLADDLRGIEVDEPVHCRYWAWAETNAEVRLRKLVGRASQHPDPITHGYTSAAIARDHLLDVLPPCSGCECTRAA